MLGAPMRRCYRVGQGCGATHTRARQGAAGWTAQFPIRVCCLTILQRVRTKTRSIIPANGMRSSSGRSQCGDGRQLEQDLWGFRFKSQRSSPQVVPARGLEPPRPNGHRPSTCCVYHSTTRATYGEHYMPNAPSCQTRAGSKTAFHLTKCTNCPILSLGRSGGTVYAAVSKTAGGKPCVGSSPTFGISARHQDTATSPSGLSA